MLYTLLLITLGRWWCGLLRVKRRTAPTPGSTVVVNVTHRFFPRLLSPQCLPSLAAATLPQCLYHNQYIRRLSPAVPRGSADAVLDVLRNFSARSLCRYGISDTHTALGITILEAPCGHVRLSLFRWRGAPSTLNVGRGWRSYLGAEQHHHRKDRTHVHWHR